MTEDRIEVGPGGTTFIGPDATRLYAASVLRSAIRLYVHTGMKANRAYTPSNMLAAASKISGESYPRGKAGLRLAYADLTAWIEAMKAALPVEHHD